MSEPVSEFAGLFADLVDRIKRRGHGEIAAFLRKTGWSRSVLYNPGNPDEPRAAMQIGADRIAIIADEVGASEAEKTRVIMAWFKARAAYGPFGAVVNIIFPALDEVPNRVRTLLSAHANISASARDKIVQSIREQIEATYQKAIDAYIANSEA